MELEALLPIWVKEHGSIYRFTHIDINYFYRRLSRREYRLCQMIEDEDERYEEISSTCLLWPIDWKVDLDDLAGIPQVIAMRILEDSGCLDINSTKDKYDKLIVSSLEKQMESIIEHVFCGGGNFDKYQDWSYDKLLESYASAKWISEFILGRPIKEEKAVTSKPSKIKESILVPDVDSGSMATRPMNEVLEKQRQAKRQQAMKEMSHNLSSK